ncbi:helix-turn-helix domain-containing protein [Brevibacillus sp. SAFN-007a]|uniref:helix-turn-helix domain-containing protein n=1 Tax=Brevibacillus sp. SAFN-007a TaxID=3436862 RepID=UPI003F806B2A
MSDHQAQNPSPPLFLLKGMQHVALPPRHTWSLPCASPHTLLLAAEGNGYWQAADMPDSCAWSPGSVRFATEKTVATIAADSGSTLSFFAFYFDVLEPEGGVSNSYSPSRSWKPNNDSYQLHSPHRCFELAFALLADQQSQNPLDVLQNQIRFQQLLHIIWRTGSTQASVESEKAIQQTLSYIHANYASSLSLTDLANQAGLTPRYYTEVFKKNVGKSPIEYVTSYRIDQAKKLLRESKKRLREVAHLVGYEDEFYFSRRFKQKVGVSPTVFAKVSQRLIAPVTFQYTEYLMALGIKPVGAKEDQVQYMREQLQVKEAKDIMALSRTCPELIKSLQPSIILTDYHKDSAAFSSIAPTCTLRWLDADVFGHLLHIADLFGQKDKALSWIKQHELKVQKTKRYVDTCIPREETVAILNVRPSHLFAYGVRNIGHVLYKSLQLTPPRMIQEKIKRDPNFWAVPVQEEQVSEYAADWLFVHVFDDDLSRAHYQALTKREDWQRLPAVQKGQVVMLSTVWFAYDPLSLDAQLDEAILLLNRHKSS